MLKLYGKDGKNPPNCYNMSQTVNLLIDAFKIDLGGGTTTLTVPASNSTQKNERLTTDYSLV